MTDRGSGWKLYEAVIDLPRKNDSKLNLNGSS